MNILAVNCGSSSLKVRLADIGVASAATVAEGGVTAIGDRASVRFHGVGVDVAHVAQPVSDHSEALHLLLRFVRDAGGAIDAVGHRVVYGGAYDAPALIDEDVIRTVGEGTRLAPLHNGPALAAIAVARTALPGTPMVAVFDTSFHRTIPDIASRYGISLDLSLKHGIRRLGYHGIAHRSMTERFGELRGADVASVSLITLQLGGGCSATAVRNGVSVDTSMGLTPLEGLMMGTRPGDIDPGVLSYLQRDAGLSLDELDDLLERRSGLLGVSGTSSDMAVLLREEAEGDPRAHQAIEMFCYRVRKYIGAYFAVLGRPQAVVFGGGIGERSPEVRVRICEPLGALGIRLDGQRNSNCVGGEERISAESSHAEVWVVPSDEERIIVRDTFALLAPATGDPGRDS